MIRLYSIPSITSTGIVYRTEELTEPGLVPYVVFDTSTGVVDMEDYIAWRTKTYKTSTGDVYVNFNVNNSCLYPGHTAAIADYRNLPTRLMNILTFDEYLLLKNLLIRIDMVRRRYPNPGTVINDTDGIGDGGVVSFSGGWEKKFTIEELISFIEGSLVEVNIHPPATFFYWNFLSEEEDKVTNPYMSRNRLPYKLSDLIVQGAMIRALIAWGILEVDVNFSTSDSGLSLTYDRVGHVSGWTDKLLAEFKNQKDFIKWDCVNSYGVAVGTLPYSSLGIMDAVANMTSSSGVLSMNTLLTGWQKGAMPL